MKSPKLRISNPKSLMLQGTASYVGKSLLAGILCRILRDEGFKVAPFKAQNMALNSSVTRDGGEIGRAQAFQALCAGIEPTVDMNPILLKPTEDSISQVIIHGKVYGNMSAKEYHQFKIEAKRFVLESFYRLADEYDVIIIEGAGSPAEINLRDGDIANMGLALEVSSPVVIVGDIDRGGVFASLVGTVELLKKAEKEMLKGFIINKFRGDRGLLNGGINFLEERTGVTVLGVIPYVKDINLPEEDGVTLELKGQRSAPASFKQDSKVKKKAIHIAVIRLPRISNFTDFDALMREPDVVVFYVTRGEDLECADVVIIPGSKNTIADLNYLWAKGIVRAIKGFASKGGMVVGICGGFQMLGRVVKDPYCVEGDGREAIGLGLLGVETVLEKGKKTYQVEAEIKPQVACGLGKVDKKTHRQASFKLQVCGYEIHMGETLGNERPFSVIIRRNGKPVMLKDGAVSGDGRVWGTYIHGLFDNDHFREAFLNGIRAKRGIVSRETISYKSRIERDVNVLAKVVKEHLNMERLYEIMGLTK